MDDMKISDDELLSLAHKAKENAFSPYSGFKVGAALLTKDGNIFTGCNVENASYGMTICAERVAIFNAVNSGCRPGDMVALAIASSGTNFSPCGACRQVIREFGDNIRVIFEYGGGMKQVDISSLFPFSFDL